MYTHLSEPLYYCIFLFFFDCSIKIMVYHERQSRQLCALHVLNNLLQEKAFNKSDLDEICLQLNDSQWWNPHRSPLGLGNYDVNVMMAALQLKEYQAVWFDKRK